MDLFINLAHGFSVSLSPMNLLFCLIGALVGTLIGVLPGVGPVATIAMLLPITFGLPPASTMGPNTVARPRRSSSTYRVKHPPW